MKDFVINSVENVSLITLNNVANTSDALAKIFTELGDNQINIDMICQTAPYKNSINLSFTIDQSDMAKTLTAIGNLKNNMKNLATEINSGNCKVTIFSELLKTESGVAAKLFNALAENDLHIKLITTSDVEISLLVDDPAASDVINLLNDRFC